MSSSSSGWKYSKFIALWHPVELRRWCQAGLLLLFGAADRMTVQTAVNEVNDLSVKNINLWIQGEVIY